jgi:transposase
LRRSFETSPAPTAAAGRSRRFTGSAPSSPVICWPSSAISRRFRRARQAIRLAGLDPVVSESGDSRRRGRLAKQGSPQLRYSLVEAAQHGHRRQSPDYRLYQRTRRRGGGQVAVLTVARKIGRRAYHVLHELEQEAA